MTIELYFPKDPISKFSHTGIRAPTYDFGGDTIQSSKSSKYLTYKNNRKRCAMILVWQRKSASSSLRIDIFIGI